MNHRHRVSWLARLAIAVLAACCAPASLAVPHAATTSTELANPASAAPETPITRIRRAAMLLDAQDYRAADAVLQAILADPVFPDLIDPLQLATYALSASAALNLDDMDRAWTMLDKALANPAADADVAGLALDLALEQWRPEKTIAPIVLLAAKAPQRVLELDTLTVYRLYGEITRQQLPVNERRDWLQALFDVKWKVEDGREPSALWRDLAEIRLAEANEPAAIEVARRITSANDLLAVQVDRRFDGVVAVLDPARSDPAAALAQEEQTLRAAIAAQPRNLQNVVELTYILLDGGQYQQVIETCDGVLAHVAAAGEAPAFDDMAQALPWIHDNRARGLLGVGRVDEAIVVLEAARRMEEDGGENVSQALNLASLYATLGRRDEAMASLEGVGLASPYGWMEYHSTRLYALLATPDDPRARESLAYLREHRNDSQSTYIEVMIRTGALDEASTAYREWLADAEQRNAALLSAQAYQVRPFSPLGETWALQSRQFFARPEIAAAIAEFGRIKTVPLHQLQF